MDACSKRLWLDIGANTRISLGLISSSLPVSQPSHIQERYIERRREIERETRGKQEIRRAVIKARMSPFLPPLTELVQFSPEHASYIL